MQRFRLRDSNSDLPICVVASPSVDESEGRSMHLVLLISARLAFPGEAVVASSQFIDTRDVGRENRFGVVS